VFLFVGLLSAPANQTTRFGGCRTLAKSSLLLKDNLMQDRPVHFSSENIGTKFDNSNLAAI
jgi:hypothetical protein